MSDFKKPITVGELIEKLKEYPSDMSVLVDGYEDGLEHMNFREVSAYYNPRAWCGTFCEAWFDGDSHEGEFKSLVLSRG